MDRIIPWLVVAGSSLIVIGLAALLWRPMRARRRQRDAEHALKSFRLQREQLEAKFFDLASSRGKPRGLRWLECDWHDDVTFGRDLESGMLTAFVAVNVRFEAIEGSDMEDVEAVGMVRDAAALFHFEHGSWGTGGRALFNMNPVDALSRFGERFEPISAETRSVAAR
jgi:hypothetical protein